MITTRLMNTIPNGGHLSDELAREIHSLTSDTSDPEPELVSRLSATVGALNRQGHIDTSLELLDLFEEAHPSTDRNPTPLMSTLSRLKGITRRLAGDFLEAADELMKAKVYAELGSDPGGVARALTSLGNVYGCLSHWSIAESCYQQAADIAGSHGSRALLGTARQNLVVALARQGRVREALGLLREDSRAAGNEDDGDAHFAVSRLLARAVVLRMAGFRGRATRATRLALESAESNGFSPSAAVAHGLLGDLALDHGDHRSAIAHFRQKLRTARGIAPEGDLVCEAYRGVAEAYLHRGELDRCEKALADAWRLCDRLREEYERVALVRVRASLAAERGDAESAERMFREAVRLSARHGFRLEEAVSSERQGFGHLARGRLGDAERTLEEAASIYETLGLHRLALRVRSARRALSRPWPIRRRARRPAPATFHRHGILTRDRAFISVLEGAERMARTPLPVLVIGESGVGKELVARAVHTMSGRTAAFLDINCPAIPENMLESELFGSARGAFTGAEDRAGLLAGADGGTLFLDEIGEMPTGLQAKLLRFLETSRYRRLGSHAADTVDVRVVSATNACLADEVESGRFRRDLYHRIAGVVLSVPPLRDRRGDIELLARHFASELAAGAGAVAPGLDRGLVGVLTAHDWPGNVRELKHLVECMVWSRPGARVLTEDDLPAQLDRAPAAPGAIDDSTLRDALNGARGRIAGAARTLGISRQAFYRRAAALDVDVARVRRGYASASAGGAPGAPA